MILLRLLPRSSNVWQKSLKILEDPGKNEQEQDMQDHDRNVEEPWWSIRDPTKNI